MFCINVLLLIAPMHHISAVHGFHSAHIYCILLIFFKSNSYSQNSIAINLSMCKGHKRQYQFQKNPFPHICQRVVGYSISFVKADSIYVWNGGRYKSAAICVGVVIMWLLSLLVFLCHIAGPLLVCFKKCILKFE